jgi:hypothetical protein
MKVNGNLILVEGGVIENLTLPSGGTFPANSNLGELYTLSESELEGMADGFYHHDGTAWQNLPTLVEVTALVDAIVVGPSEPFISFKPVFNTRTMITSSLAAGSYWALESVAMVATTVGVGTPVLPLFYYDPADYAVGTKFRLAVNINQNETAGSASNNISVGVCEVLRPASGGGGTNVVIYEAAPADKANVQFTALASRATLNMVSTEIEMPVTAGFYAFRVTMSAANSASATHLDITLQAEY